MQTRKRNSLSLVQGEIAARVADKDPFVFTETEKFRAVFECVSDALVTVDRQGHIELANPAMEELTGYIREELTGRALDSLSPKGAPSARTRPLTRTIYSTPGTYEDISIETKDGQLRIVDLSVRVVIATDSTFSIVVFRDLTEKKKMERELLTKHAELRNAFVDLERINTEHKMTQESLVQAGKMAALGELAAGIAHELNQPLMAIRGYAQELEFGLAPYIKGTPAEGEASIGLKEIISAADKMATIISHLRTHTRKTTEDFAVFDVRQPIEEALKMVSRQLASHGVTVTCDFGPEATIYANPFSLEQVFINLTTNARDAIDATGRGKGTIVITTRSEGQFLEISFRDDGIGMAQATKAKAFNPFFTTKEVGKGMGLGLSLSYGILSKVHGSIRIESEEGKGTTFVIRIPKDFREHG